MAKTLWLPQSEPICLSAHWGDEERDEEYQWESIKQII